MNTSRRSFLTSLAVLGAGELISAQTAGTRLRKGYMLATLPDRALSVMEKFKMLKQAGFEGVEPAYDLNPDEILKARDETGLVVASMSCGGASRLFASPLKPQRDTAVEQIKGALRNAKRFGAKSILVVPGRVDETTTYRQNWDRCTDGLRACIAVAEETGVKMAIENVWNNFLQSPVECVQFIDQFGSDKVAMHFDIGNMMCLGWPEQWIEIIGKRIVCVHIKEFSRKKLYEEGKRKGFEVDYLEGDNDWPATMAALRAIGYDGWVIAEPAYRPKGVDPLERLTEISKRMDKMLAIQP